jgi:hypothetical protein
MRTALVLGATGGVGSAVAHRLAAGGWTVRALHRDPNSIEKAEPFDWIRGDALVPEDVERAADGVPVIVHAVKPRLYPKVFKGPLVDRLLEPRVVTTGSHLENSAHFSNVKALTVGLNKLVGLTDLPRTGFRRHRHSSTPVTPLDFRVHEKLEWLRRFHRAVARERAEDSHRHDAHEQCASKE